MKIMVKLAIVFATLLLITNMAFAFPCVQESCYEVYSTKVDGSVDSEGFWSVCLYNSGMGFLCEDDGCMMLYEYSGGPASYSTNVNPIPGYLFSNVWLVYGTDVAYYINSVGGVYITGVVYDEGERSTIKGIKVDLLNCAP